MIWVLVDAKVWGIWGQSVGCPSQSSGKEALQKKCRALAGAGVPAQAMPAVNGTRSSARSGVAYRLVGTSKQQTQQIQATYSWLQKFWPKTQILLGNGLLL